MRMASTARSEEEKREYFDPPEELDKKATLLATWIRESKHMIAFTVSFKVTLDLFSVAYYCREQGSAHQLEVSVL